MSHGKSVAHAACAAFMLAWSCAAHSSGTFDFDFESGQLQPWLTSTPGGSGSTSVSFHNYSNMADVQHTGNYWHQLSYDFNYVAGQTLSFDMQALAVLTYDCCGDRLDALSGVQLTFTNQFNVALGTTGFLDATNPAWLLPNEYQVNDGVQHHYSATMESFAALAGISPSTAIAKVSAAFIAEGQSNYGANSSAEVWFDNFTNAVPEPGTQALMWAGLAFVGVAARRRGLRSRSHQP